MKLSLLQLNMNADNYWETLIAFLQKNDFDIIHLQEVCGKNMICGNISCKHDCYKELYQILAPRYKSAFASSQRYTSSQTAMMGNATFYKKSFTLNKQISFPIFKNPTPISPTQKSFENVGRTLLEIELTINNKQISFLNTHLAWAKTSKQEPHQTKQGEILLSYLKKAKHPFILTGDFNLDPEQPLIKKLNDLARNVTSENLVTNTLNPRTHRADVFPPGLAVDYIFITPDIQVNNFAVLENEDLSDHFGLTAKIEI